MQAVANRQAKQAEGSWHKAQGEGAGEAATAVSAGSSCSHGPSGWRRPTVTLPAQTASFSA